MPRLFVALRPPAAIRDALTDVMEGVPSARWQDDEQLHLTLRFIGDIDARVAEDTAVTLAGIAHPPIEMALHGVGSFDTRGWANALWAGVQPRDALARLHRKIDQALVRAGLAPERRAYLPHITLARFSRSEAADPRPWIARHAGLTSAPFTISHFALFESHMTQAGTTYEVVERFPLAPS